MLHPVGILMLLGVQWYALVRQGLGRPVEWRARVYSSGTGEEIAQAVMLLVRDGYITGQTLAVNGGGLFS